MYTFYNHLDIGSTIFSDGYVHLPWTGFWRYFKIKFLICLTKYFSLVWFGAVLASVQRSGHLNFCQPLINHFQPTKKSIKNEQQQNVSIKKLNQELQKINQQKYFVWRLLLQLMINHFQTIKEIDNSSERSIRFLQK